jgi:hypothetical protein
MTKRKAFNFYKSYYDVYKELSQKDKIIFMDALLERQFFGIEPTDLKGMAKFAYVSQKQNIDSQVFGYETKTGTTLTPSQGAYQGALAQEKGQEKEKEKEKGVVNTKGFNFGNLKKDTWKKWTKFKKDQFKFEYKSKDSEQTAISSLINLSNNNDKNALDIINQSISGGWKGLFELKQNGSTNKKKLAGT